MKYLFVFPEYPPHVYGIPYGGITNYLINMVNGLKKKGVNVFVLAPALNPRKMKEKEGIVVERIPLFKRERNLFTKVYNHFIYDVLVMMKIHRIIKKYEIQIIEGCDWHTSLFFYSFFKKTPFLIKLHGPSFFTREISGGKKGSLFQRWIEFKEKTVIKRADFLLAASVAIKEKIAEMLKIDKDRITVIPDPVERSEFHKKEIEKKTKICLFVSKLEKRKGADVVVKAAKRVIKKKKDVHFIMVGHDTPYQGTTFKNYLESLLTPEEKRKIHFVGPKPKHYLSYYYAIADIVVNHALDGAYGYTTLEAMEHGCCVVSTRGFGKEENIIEDGKDGILVNPGDDEGLAEKIIYLLDHPEQIKTLGKKAREKIHALFSPERIAELTVAYLEKNLSCA